MIDLSPEAHPVLTGLFYTALGLYGLTLLLTFWRLDIGRWAMGAAVLVHFSAMLGRGIFIEFFPLTNKMESFSAFALAVGVVAFLTWSRTLLYNIANIVLILVALVTAIAFSLKLAFPPPLMQTIWYPLHVPLSFGAYALWWASAFAGWQWFKDGDDEFLKRVDRYALWGFGLWSVSMVFGGLWGVVAWGAYFMWDAKVLWSAILWFHYAGFVHLKLTPSLSSKRWIRPAFATLGAFWVFVAYVGTSFFFGDSSHAFR